MIIVIIAGGSGTRLWPLSTHDFPKHLLKLTSNDRSLLQNTYDRIRDLADNKNIFVVPEKSHAKHVYDQLPDLPRRNILVEPARRGTASCFVLALSEIKRRKLPPQAIFFLWGDHLVSDKEAFTGTINQAAKLAESDNKLVFMGMKPSYASTGLGYIQKGEKVKGEANGVFRLKQFVEKPDSATAKLYYKSGKYLWNTGYLTGTLGAFERELSQHAPRLWNYYLDLYEALLQISRRKIYMNFISEPIDTALSEHVPDGLVIQATFDWADVGSFHDLHGVSRQDDGGNFVHGEKIELDDVSDSYIRNETEKPVAVIGVKDVAVIASENGILVTNKAQAQKVGDISKRLQAKEGKRFKWLEKL